MGLRERILEAAGIPTAEQIDKRVSRAYEAGFYDGGNDDPATGDFKRGGLGYRKLTDRYIRDGQIEFGRAIETAWKLWQSSPIAKRVLAMKRDHIIGHSAEPATNDDDLLELLTAFWKDNQFDKRASEFTMQLFGFGEQCLPAFVRESDGRVRLGYIDPQSIEAIIKNPDNSMDDWAVLVKKPGEVQDFLLYRIIRKDEDFADGDTVTAAANEGMLVTWEQAALQPWEDKLLEKYGRAEYDGSCFYFKVNAVSNQNRGMSDLLQVGDWLGQADSVLFALADREQFAKYFVVDIAIDGSEADVERRAAYYRMNPPQPGSVLVHNKSEEVTLPSPDLKQTGSIESFRAILGLILGGMGFPVHWYGFGDDANRATATVQADPTAKSLEHDQGVIRNMFLTILNFVRDQAEIAGAYTPSADNEIVFQLPEVSARDFAKTAASIQGMTVALSNMVAEGWVTNDTAAEINAKMLGEFDVQVDVADELKKVKRDNERADLDAMARQNGQLQQRMNGQQPARVFDENGNEIPA